MFRLIALLVCMAFPFNLGFADQWITRSIQVPVSEDQSVTATLKMPKISPQHEKIPVFLIFGGFEEAGRVLELIHTQRPVALASFDYPVTVPRSLELKNMPALLSDVHPLFGKTLRGMLGLVSALKKVPEIDSSRIVAIGASFGSPFVVAAAAADPDISGLVIVHGFGKIPETAEHVILRSWLPRYGWIARPMAWMLSRLGWVYLGRVTPEEDAAKLNARQHVLMISARDDSFIPADSSESLWHAIERSHAERTRVVMPGDHLMPGADLLINQIVHQVEDWSDRFH